MELNDQLGARDLLCLWLRVLDYRQTIVDLLGRPPIESLMWTMLSVPCEVQTEFVPHRIAIDRNEDSPSGLSQPDVIFVTSTRPMHHREVADRCVRTSSSVYDQSS